MLTVGIAHPPHGRLLGFSWDSTAALSTALGLGSYEPRRHGSYVQTLVGPQYIPRLYEMRGMLLPPAETGVCKAATTPHVVFTSKTRTYCLLHHSQPLNPSTTRTRFLNSSSSLELPILCRFGYHNKYPSRTYQTQNGTTLKGPKASKVMLASVPMAFS